MQMSIVPVPGGADASFDGEANRTDVWKKANQILKVLGIALVLVLPLGMWWIETASQRGLSEIQRQMRAEGVPVAPADLNCPLPSSGHNAAPVYLKLTKTLTDKPLEKSNPILNDIPRAVPVLPVKITEMERGMRERQDVVRLVHQAATMPDCVFQRDYTLGPNLLSPEYAKMRQGLRVLTEESILLLQGGKPLDAVRNETLGFHMAQHGSSDPVLISKLVGISLNTITLRFMERVLYSAGDQPGVADTVTDAINQNWKSVQVAEGMRGEIITTTVLCDMLSQGRINELNDPGEAKDAEAANLLKSPMGRVFIHANELDLMQHQRQAYYLMRLPYLQGKAKLERMVADVEAHQRVPTRMFTGILLPDLEQVTAKQAQGEAQKAVVCAAAAVIAYKQQHGKWPEALEQAMQNVPLDPFNGRPLQFHQEGNGFIVYSAGPTGTFDGGTPAIRPNSNETVFRFPMPAYYTQSPHSDLRPDAHG